MEHIAIPAGERHPPHNWAFADATARLASTPVFEDVDCVALQLDTHTYWRLVSVGPVVWRQILGDLTYPHDQMSASSLWVVNHNLGKRPSVTVVDSGGTEVEGLVTHISANQLSIEFSAPFGGKAYCN